MKAVNVRQLKNNPSAALRDARREPVLVLHRDQPEAVLVHLSDEALLAEPGVRRALATSLFRERSLSLGQAARFAQQPVAEFLRHVSRLGIPILTTAPAEVREDAETALEWRKKPKKRSPRTRAR